MSCHPHSDTAGSASSPCSHPRQEGQERRGKALAGSQEGLNSLYSAIVGGNLSPGRSLDTTWDEAKRKANSSSELIPLQCCLPSHREFPLQPRSHRHSTVFIFPAAVCHSPASLQWSWSQQTTRLKGKRLDSPAGLASRRSEAAAPGAHGPSLQEELRLAGQPQQPGWSWPRLASPDTGAVQGLQAPTVQENPSCLTGADVRAGGRRALYNVRKGNPVVVSTSSGCLCSP